MLGKILLSILGVQTEFGREGGAGGMKPLAKWFVGTIFAKKSAMKKSKIRGGGERPFGLFPKKHPLWRPRMSL